ncbi:MAG: hypothetical protein JNL65_10090 [Saprospiraceae bacterium]|nr:hypothetical protein [Saprospiraceae bacterium]HRG67424.1 hypothetical protein [Saprospiraceae bacterium]
MGQLPLIKDDGRWTRDDGLGTKDQRPRTMDQGPGTKDLIRCTMDQGPPNQWIIKFDRLTIYFLSTNSYHLSTNS